MVANRALEYIFFFSLLIGVGFLFWKLIAPLAGALAFAAIVATICYPLYERIQRQMFRQNGSLAAFATIVVVVFIVVVPLTLLGSLLLREAVSVYNLIQDSSPTTFVQTIMRIQSLVQSIIPDFSLDIIGVLQTASAGVASKIVSIFASTAAAVFQFFIALIALFYFFRDGRIFMQYLVKMSPLRDASDSVILVRLATSIRSVALGTILVALIQGTLTGFGLWLFGFERAVLWGSIAAIGALIPGLGTTIVFAPAVIYLIATGDLMSASGVALWGVLAVGFIDNLLGPYLMSRGNKLHPFLILVAVLGGLTYFGPIGFILGPVIMSLFLVLLELYAQQIKPTQ